MIPQLQPYMPTEYLPGSHGRYRQYPRSVRAQVPGTGYDVGRMAWAEQQLNLTGNQPQAYGNYATVPLRGVGDSGDGLGLVLTTAMATSMLQRSPSMIAALTIPPQGAPTDTEYPPEGSSEFDEGVLDVANQIEQAAAAADAQEAEAAAAEGFFDMKVGPVPVWALGLGGIAVVGGGAWWLMSRKKVKRNRRRRRHR